MNGVLIKSCNSPELAGAAVEQLYSILLALSSTRGLILCKPDFEKKKWSQALAVLWTGSAIRYLETGWQLSASLRLGLKLLEHLKHYVGDVFV